MPFKWRRKKARKYDISTKNLFIVGVYLLDNVYLECTLNAESTGQECLNSIAQRIQLLEVWKVDICITYLKVFILSFSHIYIQWSLSNIPSLKYTTLPIIPFLSGYKNFTLVCTLLTSLSVWLTSPSRKIRCWIQCNTNLILIS